jgi:hypothetical protein
MWAMGAVVVVVICQDPMVVSFRWWRTGRQDSPVARMLAIIRRANAARVTVAPSC